ncbi:MAG: RNA polymerase sigma factor [Rubripirellula sp.]
MNEQTRLLENLIAELNAGDGSVRGDLLSLACQQLTEMTARIHRDFGLTAQDTSTDLLEQASLRLYQSLHDLPIKDVRHFYQVAALAIRKELIQLCDDSPPTESKLSPAAIQQWAHFHETVDGLPDQQREVFELVWYHDLTRDEVAELMSVPISDIRRLWRSARLSLHDGLPADD